MLANQVEKVRRKVHFDCYFAAIRAGIRRGMVMMWNSDMDLRITSYSSHYIDAIVKQRTGKQWRYTEMYGHPETSRKVHTWNLLRRLSSLSKSPWVCSGNFNEILDQKEKSGGLPKDSSLIIDFREVLKKCGLIDLGWSDCPFTLSNKKYGSQSIKERLD